MGATGGQGVIYRGMAIYSLQYAGPLCNSGEVSNITICCLYIHMWIYRLYHPSTYIEYRFHHLLVTYIIYELTISRLSMYGYWTDEFYILHVPLFYIICIYIYREIHQNITNIDSGFPGSLHVVFVSPRLPRTFQRCLDQPGRAPGIRRRVQRQSRKKHSYIYD